MKRHYTVLRKMLKSSLTQEEKEIMEAMVKKKCAIETALYYKFVMGDQHAESLVGHLKQSKKRSGLLGRSSPGMDGVDNLFAACMLRSPGFDVACEALCMYREFMMSSGVHPRHAFDSEGIKAWYLEKK